MSKDDYFANNHDQLVYKTKNYVYINGTIIPKGVITKKDYGAMTLTQMKLLFLVKSYHFSVRSSLLDDLLYGKAHNNITSAYDLFEIYKKTDQYLTNNFRKTGETLEYLTLRYGEKKAKKMLHTKSDRVSGKNNPGYQHGGSLSPFSDKFIGYQSSTVSYTKADVCQKRKQTMIEHPEHMNTNILYYLESGMEAQEAQAALSARQHTFSLSKCQKKHGEVEGLRIWKCRQVKWQETLKSKSPIEIERINKLKATKVNYRSLWRHELDEPGIFYLINIGESLIKFGITTKHSVKHRYMGKNLDILFEYKRDIDTCFRLEQDVKKYFNKFAINKKDQISPYGWTETLRIDSNTVIEYITKSVYFVK